MALILKIDHIYTHTCKHTYIAYICTYIGYTYIDVCPCVCVLLHITRKSHARYISFVSKPTGSCRTYYIR